MTSSIMRSAGSGRRDLLQTGDVLVGLDASQAADGALRWSMQRAARLGVGLTICHVDPSRGLGGTRVSTARSEEVLDRAAAAAVHRLGPDRVTPVRAYGDVADVLAKVGADASLLVLGTHGYFGFGERLFPPTALRVMAKATCPVVVHSHLAGDHGPFAGHVVIAVDGSGPARAALALGFAYADAMGRPVAAVTITEARTPDHWTDDTTLETHFAVEPAPDGLLATEVEPFERMHPHVPVKRAVFAGRIPPGLMRASQGAELLVVGNHGRRLIAQSVLGSVPQELLGAVTCPLAVVRAPQAPGRG